MFARTNRLYSSRHLGGELWPPRVQTEPASRTDGACPAFIAQALGWVEYHRLGLASLHEQSLDPTSLDRAEAVESH